MKLRLIHDSRYQGVVLAHPLVHEVLDSGADYELEVVERICQSCLANCLVFDGALLDLLDNSRSVSVNSVPNRSLRPSMISDSGTFASSGSAVPTSVGLTTYSVAPSTTENAPEDCWARR